MVTRRPRDTPRPTQAWTTGGCPTGKRVFYQKTDARKTAKLLRKLGYGHLRAYDCRACAGIHIGHITPESL